MATVQLRVADSETPREFNLDDAVTNVSWEFSLEEQPGKLSFEIPETSSEMFFEGSNVVLGVDGQKVFDGYVFNRKRADDNILKVTAYDRLRYLQNKDSAVFDKLSLEEIFETICEAQGLPYKKASLGDYKTSPIAHDNKALYAMLQRAINETLIAKGKYIAIRDNLGELELVDISTLTTNLLIGEESLLTGYNFESSIDSETYNYVKLVQENSETKTREVYVAKDSDTIYKWGRLQYYESVDESLSEAQVKEKVEKLLKLYNRKTKTLSVKCVGVPSIIAGSGIALYISKLSSEGIAQRQYAYCTKVSHAITKGEHTMDLTLEVV